MALLGATLGFELGGEVVFTVLNRIDLWAEIEGIPYGFGLSSRPGSWFAARADVASRRLKIHGVLAELPAGIEAEARPLEGTSSVGEYSLKMVADESANLVELLASSQRRDGWLRLTGDLPASAADIVELATSGDPSAFPTTGGVFYCGRETFTYASRAGNVLSGVQRARFQIEGTETLYAHTAGDILSTYPRFIATRRCSVYITNDGTDASKLHRYSGAIRGTPAIQGLTGFELRLRTIEGELGIDLFGNQRRGRLLKGIADRAGGYSEDKKGTDRSTFHTGAAGDQVLEVDPASLSGAAWTAGRKILVRVDDEYFAGTLAANGLVNYTSRGLFGSAAVEHNPGAEVLEVLYTGKYEANGPAEHQASTFVGEHPLEVLLQLAMSRDGDAANGDWDSIPDRRSPGLDRSRVDVAGTLRIRDLWLPGVVHRERIEAKFNLKQKIAELLKPVLCYPVQLSDGRLSVRRVSSPIPGLSLRDIVISDLTEIATWEPDATKVYGRVVFRCDFDPTFKSSGSSTTGAGESGSTGYRQTFTGELQGPGWEAQEFYPGQFETHTIESPGQYSGIAGADTGAAELASRLFESIRDRYSRPPPILGLQLLYDLQDVEVGDLVRLTLANVPDVSTGARGLDGAICEVLRRSVDDAGAVVGLTVAQTSYGVQQRLMAPSGLVRAYNPSVPNTITIYAHEYADGTARVDSDAFEVGDHVRIHSHDLVQVRGGQGYTIQSIQRGTESCDLVLDGGPGAGGGVQVGNSAGLDAADVVILAQYQYQPASRQARSAFLAGDSGIPTASGYDAPHEYAT